MKEVRENPPLLLGPMWTGGADAAVLPTGGYAQSAQITGLPPHGFTRRQRNMVQRPSRWAKRPPCVYDGLKSSIGHTPVMLGGLWDDLTSGTTRLVASNASVMKVKDIGAETWSGSAGGSNLSPFDSTNYRGVLYFTNSATSPPTTIPTALFSFNGSTVAPQTSYIVPPAPFPNGLQAFSLCTALDRIVFAWVRAAVTNQLHVLGATYAYDLTLWTLTNLDVRATTIQCRIVPKVATGACKAEIADVITVPGSQSSVYVEFMSDLRSADALASTPISQEIFVSSKWQAAHAYAVGDLRVSLATTPGFRFRCIVAGTSGAAEPGWVTTVGSTTADGAGALAWICDGSDALASLGLDLPSLTDDPNWVRSWVTAVVPPSTNGVNLGSRIRFGNANASTWTQAGVDVSYRDHLADGDPLKANRGQQVTLDSSHPFDYPFYNSESSATATIEIADMMWSEQEDIGNVRPENFQRVFDVVGHPTAVRSLERRVGLFKRKGAIIYQGTTDPDTPFIYEAKLDVGCLHHRAIDIFEKVWYWIGENEIYRWVPGGIPQPLLGSAMREEVMNQSASSWVESQAICNVPLLKVNQKEREVWVYTQKGKIYVYDIDGKHAGQPGWSYIDTLGPSGSLEVASMNYNPTTRKMYISDFGDGTTWEVRRFDATIGPSYDTDNAAVSYLITNETIPRPIELLTDRRDFLVEEIGIRHSVALGPAVGPVYVYASFDQGATYPAAPQVNLRVAPVNGTIRDPVTIWQARPSIELKIQHVGTAGEESFNMSALDVWIQDLGEEYVVSRSAT